MHKITYKQTLPVSIDRAWNFFTDTRNLSLIMPRQLDLKILSASGGYKLHAGQIIKYRIAVAPFVKVHWESEIVQVSEKRSFTDIQRSGPFTSWSHQHLFSVVERGVEITDHLEYSVPLGALGRIANQLLVDREVRSTFEYRIRVLNQLC
jgi:ligand-binding SRPBCC domain-containing protein